MDNIFVILLKKEFRELFANKKLFLFVFVIGLLPHILAYVNFFINSTILITLIMMTVSQYMFDSCSNDVSSGGALFLYNIKAGFWRAFFAKLMCSVFLGLLFFLISFSFLGKVFTFADICWIIPSFIFTSAFTYLITIFTRRSDFMNMIIGAFIILGTISTILQIESIALRAIIMSVFSIIILCACKLASRNMKYRSSL